MLLSLIVAIADDGAIGKDNGLPWHLPADLQFFKKTTLGKPVIMGRHTWDSLGKALRGRLNVVLSSQKLELPEGVLLFNDISQALERVKQEPVDEAFMIGGSRLFEEAMPQLQRMYITRVRTTVPGADTFFPDVDYSQWKLTWEEAHETDEQNKLAFTFQQWDRISQ